MRYCQNIYFPKALPISQKDKRKERKGTKRVIETSDVSETASVTSTISTINAINPSFAEDQRLVHSPYWLMNFVEFL